MKVVILIITLLMPVGVFAIAHLKSVNYPELWLMIKPNLPPPSEVYILPDGSGICLAYNDEMNQWFVGYITATCANSPQPCLCYFFIDKTLQSANIYWGLKKSKRISFEEDEQGGDKVQLFQMRNVYDLCFHRESQSGACLIGYSRVGSTYCSAEGNMYRDYFLVRYKPPERLKNIYEALGYTVLIVGFLGGGICFFCGFLLVTDMTVQYLKKKY